mmetsp:Transcript_24407/g.48608  ORF Transcript_24407/g.48608 Transcript_24407/m.48608 type:complete len:88 (-) Transcript_24407:292-555(-)
MQEPKTTNPAASIRRRKQLPDVKYLLQHGASGFDGKAEGKNATASKSPHFDKVMKSLNSPVALFLAFCFSLIGFHNLLKFIKFMETQ